MISYIEVSTVEILGRISFHRSHNAEPPGFPCKTTLIIRTEESVTVREALFNDPRND